MIDLRRQCCTPPLLAAGSNPAGHHKSHAGPRLQAGDAHAAALQIGNRQLPGGYASGGACGTSCGHAAGGCSGAAKACTHRVGQHRAASVENTGVGNRDCVGSGGARHQAAHAIGLGGRQVSRCAPAPRWLHRFRRASSLCRLLLLGVELGSISGVLPVRACRDLRDLHAVGVVAGGAARGVHGCGNCERLRGACVEGAYVP